MFAYMGLAAGDLASGLLSQLIKSRRKAVFVFLLITLGAVFVYLRVPGLSLDQFYMLCLALGFGSGYWAVFVTIGAEQFGTNLRATVTTTVPNFVRGSVVPLTLSFGWAKGVFGVVNGGLLVGAVALSIALLALSKMEETFHKDLNFIEDLP